VAPGVVVYPVHRGPIDNMIKTFLENREKGMGAGDRAWTRENIFLDLQLYFGLILQVIPQRDPCRQTVCSTCNGIVFITPKE